MNTFFSKKSFAFALVLTTLQSLGASTSLPALKNVLKNTWLPYYSALSGLDLSHLKITRYEDTLVEIEQHPKLQGMKSLPCSATYTTKNGKTLQFLGVSHFHPSNGSAMNKLFSSEIKPEILVGEYPAISTFTGRRLGIISPTEIHKPFTKCTFPEQLKKISEVYEKRSESHHIEVYSKQNNIPLISGEDHDSYLKEIKNFDPDLTKTAALKMFFLGLLQSPEIKVTSDDLSYIDSQINPDISKSYHIDEIMNHTAADMMVRDYLLATTIFNAFKKHDRVGVVYGAAHWMTLENVLKHYLGDPAINFYNDCLPNPFDLIRPLK